MSIGTSTQRQRMLEGQLEDLKMTHQSIFDLLEPSIVGDPIALAAFESEVLKIEGHADFREEARGASYRENQKARPLVREFGDQQIFTVLDGALGGLGPQHVGLDIIGGNGTTARVAGLLRRPFERPRIISADPNPDMIADAQDQGLPALWQGGQRTMLRAQTLDFVVATRGFHHIPVGDRQDVFNEAYRIIKPGGVFLGVDFEANTPTARWYSEALEKYTDTGHPFDHFTKPQMWGYADLAGFEEVQVFSMYDPFRIVSDKADRARSEMLDHLVGMFGLAKLAVPVTERTPAYYSRVAQVLNEFGTFRASEVAFEPSAVPRPCVYEVGLGAWQAEFPRVALCVMALKR